jgi:hypothetical protein
MVDIFRAIGYSLKQINGKLLHSPLQLSPLEEFSPLLSSSKDVFPPINHTGHLKSLVDPSFPSFIQACLGFNRDAVDS